MSSTSPSLLQQINTIPNPGGVGLPVTTYAQEEQKALQLQLTTVPNQELSALSSQQSALQSLQTAMQNLQTATNSLASSQNWNSVTATSSDTSSFTVTATSGAQPGIYNIAVNSLASYDTWVANSSQSSSTGSSTLAADTLVLQPSTLNSGAAVSISISSGESLSSVAAAINADTSTTGIQAQIVQSGSSSFNLTLSATQSGSAYDFKASDSANQFSLTHAVTGTDASISLDGLNVTSSTNSFTSAIPNVTINALKTTATGVTDTLSLNQDSTSTVKNVQSWMSAYNSVVDILKTDTAYTPASTANNSPGTSGPLFSDSNANQLLNALPTTVMQSVTNNVQSSLSSLASIGIVLDPSTGHLEFQPSTGFQSAGTTVSLQDGQTMFQNAMQANAAGVQALFGVVSSNTSSTAISTSGVLGNLTNQLNTYLIGAGGQPGLLSADLTSISKQQTAIQSNLTQINQQITDQVNNFTQQLNNLNAAMQKAQFQMQQFSALFGGSAAASSAATSSASSSSSSGTTTGG